MSEQTYPQTQRDENVCDVFATAMEGGVNYWARVTDYVWSDGSPTYRQIMGFGAHLTDSETGEDYGVVDARVIRRGISRAYAARQDGTDYHSRAIRDLYWGKSADFDADTADMIVQYGVLGVHTFG